MERAALDRRAGRRRVALVAVRVDSHIHFWDRQHTPQPWMTSEHAAIARPFGPSDIQPLLERNGVESVILVQGACLDADTDYLFEEAARNDWIGAVTAWVCLDDPERAALRLDELQRKPKLRAVRHLTHNEPDHWITRPSVLESLAMLEARELILEIPVVFPRHFDDVSTLADRFPRLRIVVDHLGKPPIGSPEMSEWATQLRATAEYPNVFAKVSGLNTALDWPDWTADDLRASVDVAVDAFGPSRLMCGSDWPVALLNGDYDKVWGLTSRVLAAACPDEVDALLGGNAGRLYRLKPPGGTS
jgi:L-fuconolactonase